MKLVLPAGLAPATCRFVVGCSDLLSYGSGLVEMERVPGLAPGKNGFAVRRFDDFGITRMGGWGKWGDRRVLPPLGDLHRSNAGCYITVSI